MTTFISTRLDDIPLVLAVIRTLNLDTILDAHLHTHGNTMNHNALTNGEAICIWLLFLLTQGNHRKWKMDEWVQAQSALLSALWGAPVLASDFSDDRLTTLAAHLSRPAAQGAIDQALGLLTMTLFRWDTESIRLDGTNFRGYHQCAEGIMQMGYAKGETHGSTQFKLMAASTATGQYLTGHFHPGNLPDDRLYSPVLEDLFTWCPQAGMLFVGDCKMGALATRALVAQAKHYYYMPLSDGAIPKHERATWITAAIAGTLPGFAPVWREDTLLGYGFEFTRSLSEGAGLRWDERVLLIRSQGQVDAEYKRLQRHLSKAQEALMKLTVPPRQGVVQFTEETTLQEAIQQILTQYDVEGLVGVRWNAHPYQKPSKKRADPTTDTPQSHVRFQITAVPCVEERIRERTKSFGWRVFVTNAPVARINLAEGVLLYRQGAGQGIERMNRILKDHDTLGLDRLYVTRDDQIVGLTYLVTLALRVMMDIELKVRKGLVEEQTPLVDYYPNGITSMRPTTKTMLERICFRGVTLLEITEQGQTKRHLTELPAILRHILRYLGLSADIYTQLIE